MNNFFFFPVLRALNDGRVIRRCMSFLLYALAVLTLLGGLFSVYEILKTYFAAGVPTEFRFAAIIAVIIFAATFLACAQVFWFRAGSIRDIPEGPFTVIPLMSVLLRAVGEVIACLLTAVGVVGCLTVWLTKAGIGLPISIPGVRVPSGAEAVDNSFITGLLILIYAVLAAIAYLLFFVFLAEAMLVTVDIAIHVRMLVRQNPAPPAPQMAAAPPQPPQPQYAPQTPPPYTPPPQQYGAPPPPQYGAHPTPGYGAPQQPPYAPPQAPPSTMQRCPTCGAEVPVNAPFCGRCGSSLMRK